MTNDPVLSNVAQPTATANDPIQDLLNEIIKEMLPKINSAIQNAISANHLDPWGQVASGSDTLGKIDLGICTASADASYAITNMRGLSSFTLDSIILNSASSGENNTVVGDVSVVAHMGSDLSTNVSGKFSAGCGFIHPSVGIGGTATVSGLSAHANGRYTASTSNGQVCLSELDVRSLTVDYGNVNVHIDGLGIFSSLLDPLVSAIVNLFNGDIKGDISSAVTPIIDREIAAVLPQCKAL